MKEKNRKNVLSSNTFLTLLAIAMLAMSVTKTTMAKSLYVIADILGASEERTQPVQAYDIGVDGTLTFQAQHDIPHSMLGAVGMAIDSDYGYVFITYEASGEIQLIEATTMTNAGTTTAPDATDLAGIVYDHENSLLYCVDRGRNNLYVYNWFPDTATLTHVPGSPFTLRNASPFGIALDEIDDLLYVANASNTVTVYSTSDWSLVDTISVSRIAISIAIDVTNGFLYTGGGFAGNMFLTQYHLATGTEVEVQVEPDAGVMGLGVDPDTGLVYISTGVNNAPGGDNLLVYDAALNQIDIVTAIGNPTGLAIPGRDIGYNPLNLKKQVLRGATTSTVEIPSVGPGDIYTYGISFDNNNDYTVTDVLIIDLLPDEVSFISADDDGVNGHYDPDTHSYIWSYQLLPPGTSTLLELTVKVDDKAEAGEIITNQVTINSNQTTPTTTSVDVIVLNNALNLNKSILVPEGIEGQITQVEPGDTIIYGIDFNNKDNDFPVNNISVLDSLPKEVTFISARDQAGKEIGKYDDIEHIWTWSVDVLEPGEAIHLELEVSVNLDIALGTIITNIVTINSDETAESSATVEAATYYKPLNITKIAIDKAGDEIIWVDPGERFTYQICFDNNNNEDSQVTDVFLSDTLPKDVTFVSDHVDNKDFIGQYDPKSRTYTGTLKSLDPGIKTCIDLVVDVDPNTPLGTIIANSVIIDSNETLPAIADVNVPVGEILTEVDNLSITPNVLRRNGASPTIMAEVDFSEGITKDDIEPNDEPLLYYQDRDSDIENFILIGKGSQYLSGTEDRPRLTILFSRPELMDAVYGYGEVKLRVEGILKSGLTYFGEATIHITRFAGD